MRLRPDGLEQKSASRAAAEGNSPCTRASGNARAISPAASASSIAYWLLRPAISRVIGTPRLRASRPAAPATARRLVVEPTSTMLFGPAALSRHSAPLLEVRTRVLPA